MRANLFVAGLLVVCCRGISAGPARRGSGTSRIRFSATRKRSRKVTRSTTRRAPRVMAPTAVAEKSDPRSCLAIAWTSGVSDAQTFNVIKNGVQGTPMKPQGLPDSDIWKIVTYIHALRGTAIDNPLPGDIAHGEAVFWGKGQCGSCHMLCWQGRTHGA